MSHLDEINELISLRIKADTNENLVDLYQLALREIRPTPEEFYFIEREVAIARAGLSSNQSNYSLLPSYIPTRDVINAFKLATPMQRIYNCINRSNVKWQDNAHDIIKAYVMACFSEIAYLHLTDIELNSRDRYKIFEPSVVQWELFRRRLQINLTEIMPSVADISVRVIETENFVYIIAQVNSFTVIAVRGTVATSLSEWMIDFDALKNPARNGFYHRGFDDEAKIALPLLLDATEDRRRSRLPLYITGHSLGGAVASILSQVWPETDKVMTPYVFASPRFGTRAAARRQPRFSYIRPFDIVPHVPPRRLGFSDEGAQKFVIPSGSEQASGSRSAWTMISSLSVEQHSMDRHRELLGKDVGERFPELVYLDALVKQLKSNNA